MYTSLLKEVGQVAGLGGIALGVLLLVYRDFLRRKLFPRLTREQSQRLLLLIILLTWSVAVLGVGAWAFVEVRGTPTHQQPPRFMYTGRVSDKETLQPIPGAKIVLAAGPMTLTKYTDDEGVYSFSIPAKDFPPSGRVRVEIQGYKTYEREVSLVLSQTEDIRLASTRPEPLPPPVKTEVIAGPEPPPAPEKTKVIAIRATLDSVSKRMSRWPLELFDGGEILTALDPVKVDVNSIPNFSQVHSELAAELWRIDGAALLVKKPLLSIENFLKARNSWRRSLDLNPHQPSLIKGASILEKITASKFVKWEEYFSALFEAMRVPDAEIPHLVEIYMKGIDMLNKEREKKTKE